MHQIVVVPYSNLLCKFHDNGSVLTLLKYWWNLICKYHVIIKDPHRLAYICILLNFSSVELTEKVIWTQLSPAPDVWPWPWLWIWLQNGFRLSACFWSFLSFTFFWIVWHHIFWRLAKYPSTRLQKYIILCKLSKILVGRYKCLKNQFCLDWGGQPRQRRHFNVHLIFQEICWVSCAETWIAPHSGQIDSDCIRL